MIILGVDPGTRFTGYGLIEKNGRGIQHIDNGLIAPSSKMEIPLRLKQIFEGIQKLIQQFSPSEIALEDVFMAKNVKSSLKLGYARGVVMLAAAIQGVSVYEYPPAQVKQAITGFGQATKEQMQKMVKIHLKLKEVAQEDATDALAVALCHCQTKRFK
ncbi:MAG: crossover junction endodeoxyribonuclease RuvC [Deltaproteobacteria bacterium RIFCSPLOWO2_01_44_7]|nr:MAG: crossover junction endodeoxyribonuclease RuvC [Deltaproteobacteria bacterium RIFCSPHIGHO2_01_FULL_43_49]OGQ16212.1 MAG: crossover junction endodeoxyribonuclease RuvC [Deltaproteobacteria bacterium RIFCSPHIGHO2_02_FULL_44_53]OGQ29172.1 MAG: crossover junction endodeoxyribonuclease RuvC [Deltaproteobacteria bacterium RIFCSPHIGHO2_12_FULL_44_21]OGQ32729.1 MAG: crossover junction endodeoxyribonuclease RuvC [Deltaproteobacteria bacterium RIFCSPLOWO2_01_FULL_45_74]OGQ41831.1 MAG: crossover ju